MRLFGHRSARRITAIVAAGILAAGTLAVPAVLAAGATQSTTSLAMGLNPKPVGQTSTITATVTPGATGDVIFWDNAVEVATVTLSGGQASWTMPADAAAGNHDIRAQYQGDGTYAASEDNQVIAVGPRPVAVTIAVSGPRDATGQWAQRGDVLTVTATVSDAGTTGSLAVSGGTVQVKVDGVVKGTITLPATSVDLATAEWPVGNPAISATYDPGVATDHEPGTSPYHVVNLLANTVDATGLPPSPSTFYPYRDGYLDVTRIRGTRAERASVSIAIYNSAGKRVRLLAVSSGISPWSVAWNGRTSTGVQVAAGRYTIRQTVRDSLGATKRLPATYVTVSSKRIYTHTVTLRKTLAQRSAGSPSKGWVGWSFTLPSAAVYKKLVFGVYGKSGSVPLSVFGPHDKRYCGWTAWDVSCINPVGTIPLSKAWGNKTGNVTYNRSGRSVKMYAVALNYTTSVTYARVIVTYGVLK